MKHTSNVFRVGAPRNNGTEPGGGTPHGNAQGRVSRKVRALVIDDSDTARARTASLLRLAGCHVHELPSAIGASRLALREDIEVAMVDIGMPGLSGDKLIQVFKSNSRLCKMIVVVVSGRSEEELAVLAKGGLPDAVLPKSRINDELIPLLHRLLPDRFPFVLTPAGTAGG